MPFTGCIVTFNLPSGNNHLNDASLLRECPSLSSSLLMVRTACWYDAREGVSEPGQDTVLGPDTDVTLDRELG